MSWLVWFLDIWVRNFFFFFWVVGWNLFWCDYLIIINSRKSLFALNLRLNWFKCANMVRNESIDDCLFTEVCMYSGWFRKIISLKFYIGRNDAHSWINTCQWIYSLCTTGFQNLFCYQSCNYEACWILYIHSLDFFFLNCRSPGFYQEQYVIIYCLGRTTIRKGENLLT